MAEGTRQSSLRALTVVLATVVPLAILAGLLVMGYLASREAKLVARTYRHLRSIGEQMATTMTTKSQAVTVEAQWCLPSGAAEGCHAPSTLLDGAVVDSLGFDEVVLTEGEEVFVTSWGRARLAIQNLAELGPGELCAGSWWPATTKSDDPKGKGTAAVPSAPARSERRTVCWLDRAYLLFSVPLMLPDGSRSAGAMDQPLWLHALVDSNRFHDDKWRLPYAGIVIASLVVLLLLLTWPLIRLRALDVRERVRAVDLAILGVCLVAAAGLSTIGLLAAVSESRSRAEEDVALHRLAGEVRDRFRREVHDSIEQLDAFQRVRRSPAPNVPLVSTHLMGMTYALSDGTPALRLRPTPGRAGSWRTEQYFGRQPKVDERPYFVDAQRQNLWRLHGERRGQSQQRGSRASVEVVRSKLTSKLTLVVARPLSWRPGAKIDVILASSDLRPFNPPSLPLGYGYAIVAGDGTVQLHSEVRRSLIENFFEENEHAPVVEARVRSGSPDPFDMRYLGEDHRAVAVPLAGPDERIPWTVVAFREREVLRTPAKESMLAAGVIFAAWLIGWVVVLVGMHAFTGRGRAEWLWPHRGADGARAYGLASLLLLLVGAVGLGFAGRLAETGFLLSFGVPIAATAAVYAWLRHDDATDEPARVPSETAFRAAYACFLTSLVALLGVLPAVAAYSDARAQAEHDLRTYQKTVQADRRAERLRRIDENRPRDPTWVIQERVADACDVYDVEEASAPAAGAIRFTSLLRDWLPVDATGAALQRAAAWNAGPAPAAVGTGQTMLVALIVVSSIGVLLWAGSPSVFLLDADRDASDATQAPGVVRWCFERRRGWQRRPAVVIDLRDPPSAMPEWVLRRTALVPADSIEIRHAQAWLGDAGARDLLRELLERLVAAEVVVRVESDVDLRQALAAESGDAAPDGVPTMPWRKVLAAFTATREFLDVGTALADADHERESLHQSLWDRLSADEQRTLWQLAREGFINPQGIEVTKSLFRKGLVRRNGALHVATPGLRQFVLRTVTPDVVAKWEGEGSRAWDRRPLSAALGLAAIFLLYTQPDFFNSTVATIGSVTVAIPTLLRFFSMLGEGKSAPSGAA